MISRRQHQCHRDGCDSPATHQLHLHIRYGRYHRATEHLVSTLRVCDSKTCRKAANDYLLSEHNKGIISAKLATIGRLTIDWPNAMVEFVPIGELSVADLAQLGQMQTLGTA